MYRDDYERSRLADTLALPAPLPGSDGASPSPRLVAGGSLTGAAPYANLCVLKRKVEAPASHLVASRFEGANRVALLGPAM